MNSAFDRDNYKRLNVRIEELLDRGAIRNRREALIYLILHNRFYCQSFEIEEAMTDGGNDLGIDAIHIDRRGDEPAIHLFQSKVHESERKAANAFPCSTLEKAIRFFSVLKNPASNLKKLTNPSLEQKILEIRDVIRTDFPTFKLWLVSNGIPCVSHELDSHISALRFHENISVEEFHLNEIVEICLDAHSKRPHHVFNARETGVLEGGNSELRSAVGYISANALYDLIKDIRDETRIDYAVFNLNVRGFLGFENPVNKEIVRSAASSAKIHFASLNNGITIVGSTLRVSQSTDQPKVKIKQMSIVNGAQTCHAIFSVMKDYYPNFEAFRDLSVLFRIFETDDPDIISNIAISTNNQNRISPRDLRANDVYQISLEAKLKEHGISYQRKRQMAIYDEANVVPAADLDALRAGQILLSYIYLDPVRAKRNSDSIFTDLYGRIFGHVDISQLIEGYRWFEMIYEHKKYIEDEIRIKGAQRTDNTFVTYGVFHILMMCSLINPRASDADKPAVIDEALEMIAQHLSDVGEPAYYEYFRNSRFAEELKERTKQPKLL